MSTPLASRSSGFAFTADDSPEARIGRCIQPQPDGCWLYNGRSDGYVIVHGVHTSLHRWVYETLVGPIDEGTHIHHECGNKACCNPKHLAMLTPAQHAAEHKRLRSVS